MPCVSEPFVGRMERTGSAQPIWSFWDLVAIEETAMIGWWEDDAPVKAALPLPPPPPPGKVQYLPTSVATTCEWRRFDFTPDVPNCVMFQTYVFRRSQERQLREQFHSHRRVVY
jgi:hypothetical protein